MFKEGRVSWMNMFLTMFAYLLYLTRFADVNGTCTNGCHQSAVTNDSDVAYPCSCSSSCGLYGDCCRNSPFMMRSVEEEVEMNCLWVSGIGYVSAVGSCPSSWTASGEFCRKGIGFLQPVTNLRSGTTYMNIHCAICNRDSRGNREWNVRLVCCRSAYSQGRFKSQNFVFYRDHLWLELRNGDSKTMCQCKFQASEDSIASLKKLPLRPCFRKEVSTCAVSWKGRRTEARCGWYLDPVHVDGKIYRNPDCATCNYETESRLACVPPVVHELLLRGVVVDGIGLRYCENLSSYHDLKSCLLSVYNNRGISYAFSDLFDPNAQSRTPQPVRRCCEGEMYDHIRKRCRRLRSSTSSSRKANRKPFSRTCNS